MAEKSNHNELGIDQNEFQENYGDPQVLAHGIAEQPRAVARALPFLGNLRPDALLPVVVQPWTGLHSAVQRDRDGPFRPHPRVLSARSSSAVTVLRGERATLDPIIHIYYLSRLRACLRAQSVFFNTTTRPGQVSKLPKPLFTTTGRRIHVVGGLGGLGKRTTNSWWSLSTV